MTTRSHQLTFLVGIVILCVTVLLFLLHKTHTQFQFCKTRLQESEQRFHSLSRQFDSLYQYKDRLEKSFMGVKESKDNLLQDDNFAKQELSELKSAYMNQIQSLQDEIESYRRKEERRVISNNNNNNNQNNPSNQDLHSPQSSVPINRYSRQNMHSSNININNVKSQKDEIKFDTNHQHFGVQSPIVGGPQVLPSGDPNIDTAGNLLI